MIRRPKDDEGFDCLRLMYISGKDMFSYFLIMREPEIYKCINVFYTKPGVLFSRDNVLVKIENEKVCGLLITVPIKDMKQMDKNMMKYGKELFRYVGFINMIKMMMRSSLQKYLAVNFEDEYYISNIAVFDEFRGKGFGVELLMKAEQLAREKGFNKLSLAVEFYNKEAKRIYEKFGFIEEKKIEFPKKYHKFHIEGFYKMVKVLN
jgi:ribosomal protein S18 acetylase RimI-like enzyme